jgi:hypothetical protein
MQDDPTWRALLKLYSYLKPRFDDDPDLAADWAFLPEYMQRRHGAHAPAAASSASGGGTPAKG